MRIHIGHHFYGAGNFGDDLMMAGFLRAWTEWGSPGDLTCSIPFDRDCQQRRFPQVAWLPYDAAAREHAIRHCTVWLGLGGPAFETESGPWMLEHQKLEIELCRRYRKPMFFLCVGVSNRESLDEPVSQAVLDQVEHIWTRDRLVAEMLRSVCPSGKITAGADLAHLCLSEEAPQRIDRDRLGWVIHFDNTSLLHPPAVAAAIERLRERQHCWLVQEIRELPGSELATLAALPETVRATLQVCLPDYGANAAANLPAAWPACGTMITSRFHGAMVAAWRGARVVVLERDDKLRGAAQTLGCKSLSSARDADELCAAIAASSPVERSLLEEQQDIAWRCCAAFFRHLKPSHPRSLARSSQPVLSQEDRHVAALPQ
jgi:polysaccharide pyruvyl transferase WcaK-like protein